jgi:hypothetical protein
MTSENPKPEETPFAVQTFTAEYDPAEDRIRLNVQSADGDQQSIMMTRRVLDRVIPIVGQHLEAKTPRGVPPDLVQAMNQQKVRQARREDAPPKPVKLHADVPRWLCKTVQVQRGDNGMALTFSDDGDASARLTLANTNLHAALDILRATYAKAAWGRDKFPHWLEDEAPVASEPRKNKLN